VEDKSGEYCDEIVDGDARYPSHAMDIEKVSSRQWRGSKSRDNGEWKTGYENHGRDR
jgi:hypothetical protein